MDLQGRLRNEKECVSICIYIYIYIYPSRLFVYVYMHVLTCVCVCVCVCVFLPHQLSNHYTDLDFKLSPCVECRIVFLGNLPASGLLVPTFRNFLSVPSS